MMKHEGATYYDMNRLYLGIQKNELKYESHIFVKLTFFKIQLIGLLNKFDNIDIYIDGIGTFPNSWNSHISKLNMKVGKLQGNNFIINPRKYK